jgi:hypothetical protein
MSADLIYSLVLAFTNSKIKSELLYLIEPHILARRDEFNAGQLVMLCSNYVQLEQGTVEFLKQITTLATLKA